MATQIGKEAKVSPSHAAIARRYLVAALGCALFAFIYAQFSHGVYSPFMTFMFAIPLLGGAAVALALHLAKAEAVPRLARQSWALALAALTIGSCLLGIFEIAGTSSPYLIAYPAIAVVFAAIAVFALGFSRKNKRGPLKQPQRSTSPQVFGE